MRGTIARRILVFGLLVALSAVPMSAQDIFDIAAVLFAGRSIEDILNDFQKLSNQLLQDAQTDASGVVSSAGEQIHVAIQDMSLILSQQQKTFFKDLNDNEVAVFSHLNDLIASVNNASNTVLKTEQFTFVDLQSLLNKIPFVQHTSFMVSSFSGLVMNSDTTFHQVSLIGLGFGTDDSNTRYQVSVSVRGLPLPSDASLAKGTGQRDVVFPDGMLSGLFTDTTLTNVPVHLTSVIQHVKHHVLGKDTWTNDPPVGIDFDLQLLPRLAGTLTFSYLIPDGQKPSGALAAVPTMQRTVKDCTEPCVIENLSSVIPDNEQFDESSIKYSCIGDGCSQCLSFHLTGRASCNAASAAPCDAQYPVPACKIIGVPTKPGAPPKPCAVKPGGPPDEGHPPGPCDVIYCPQPDPNRGQLIASCIESRCAHFDTDPDYQLSLNNTRIDVYRSCTGSSEATVMYDASYQTFVNATKPGPPQTAELHWGQDTVVVLPTDTFSADGKIIFTNQAFTFDQVSGTSNPYIKLVGVAATDDGQFRVTVRPIPPIVN